MPATRGRLMANQDAVRVTHGGSGLSTRERHRRPTEFFKVDESSGC